MLGGEEQRTRLSELELALVAAMGTVFVPDGLGLDLGLDELLNHCRVRALGVEFVHEAGITQRLGADPSQIPILRFKIELEAHAQADAFR